MIEVSFVSYESSPALNLSIIEREGDSWQFLSMEHLEWWLEGLLLFVTAIIGILGNVFFIAIFNYRKYYRNTFHW